MKTAFNGSLKKGFTIVELAIVLVVIGIILGMAVKGKTLVDTARMKAEVAKLNKFEAAVSVYYSYKGSVDSYLTTDWTSPYPIFDHRQLLEMGLITAKDRESYLVKNTGSSTSIYLWSFFGCGDEYAAANKEYGKICVGIVSTEGNGSGMPYTAATQWNTRYLCNVEVIKDDENVTTGYGRREGRSSTGVELSDENFKDCSSVASTVMRAPDQYTVLDGYWYRVF